MEPNSVRRPVKKLELGADDRGLLPPVEIPNTPPRHLRSVIDQDLGGDASDFEVDGVKCDNLNENDVSDEEIESEELTRRMWKDRVKLKRIKERERLAAQRAALETSKPKQPSEQALRKKMSRAQDGILKYMLKLMEVCNVRGFVYGIIPEKGKPVSGASDNIRAWWKEKDSGHRERREDTNSCSDEYDVDGLEDARGSTSCKDDAKNLQVETLPCAVTSREEGPAVNSNQLCQGKEQTSEQLKQKRPRLSVTSADRQTAETHNEHIPKETRNAIPDMNDTDMSMLVHHAPSVSHETHMNLNSRHQGRDLQNQNLEPQYAISNFASIPSSNVAAGNMFTDDQPLQYPEVGNSELEFATTIDTGSNYGFYKSSGGSGILQDKQQHPMFVPGHSVRSDDSIIPVGNNSYDHVMTPNVNSHTITGDMHLFVDGSFYTEPDRFDSSSFGLPLDLIGISSPIPDIGDILHDDDIMDSSDMSLFDMFVWDPTTRHC
ncbi:hypothetical protein C4D60_Mb09t23970 [Musa balbisiana]|uniref:Ethylene insensitive 3-like DNA-binding domain-containing protein n=1 Tax=Musa balbisiana TaxID=52838 RepID=A0A4S8IK13_MUSBA|nr:hypothetical protein C4D60_Mb09t23970 [Musa balbisiana]